MFDVKQLHYLCTKYKIKYKVFESTNQIYIDSNLDEWLIKYVGNNRDRPYCLMHKNKIRQTKKFHVQGYKAKLSHALDSIVGHKGILKNIYAPNTYKQKTKIKRRKNYCQEQVKI